MVGRGYCSRQWIVAALLVGLALVLVLVVAPLWTLLSLLLLRLLMAVIASGRVSVCMHIHSVATMVPTFASPMPACPFPYTWCLLHGW
jgi:hypothetical protein